VDSVGVHELFPGRRQVTHPWKEIEGLEEEGEDAYVLHTRTGPVRLDRQVEHVRRLASSIRAVLRGEKPITPPPLPAPTAEQIAYVLEVKPEELPRVFRVKGHRFHLEIGTDGLTWVNGRGERKLYPWGELLEVRGSRIKGRSEDLLLPWGLENRAQVLSAVLMLLLARGDVPEADRAAAPLVPDTALSKTPKETTPAADAKALSRSAAKAEDASGRLTGEETEEEREGIRPLGNWALRCVEKF